MNNPEENFERIKCGNCKDWKNKSCESACREECYLNFFEEQNKQLLDALKDKQKAISNVHCTNYTDKNINNFCVHCIYNFESITGKKAEEHHV